MKTTLAHIFKYLRSGLFLRAFQARLHIIRVGLGDDRRRRQKNRLEHALFHKTIDDTGRDAGGMGKPALRPSVPFGCQLHRPLAGGGKALRPAFGQPQPLDHRFGIEGGGRTQRHASHQAGRRKRIGGNPVNEAAHLRLQRRAFKTLGDGPQLLRIDTLFAGIVPHHTEDLPGTKRHLNDGTGFHHHILRHGVAVGPGRRHGHENGHRARGRRRVEQSPKQIGRIFCHDVATMPRRQEKGNRPDVVGTPCKVHLLTKC
ncbi:hypothetical protein D3C72_979490 [compost metagenome]